MSNEQHLAGTAALIPAPGDDLGLAFANTLSWRGRPEPTESLTRFDDLRRWLAAAAALPTDVIAGWARHDPGQEAAAFADAIALREAIYRIFSAIAGGESVRDGDLAILNDALAAAPPRARLAGAPSGFVWQTALPAPTAAVLLAPIIWSAADLLTRAASRRIRRCANNACLWLFIDESKTGTRRWCDMSSCGNRAKSRRHYLKTRRD